jgi:hypothetical protein
MTRNEHHDLFSKVAPATDARIAWRFARTFDPVGVPVLEALVARDETLVARE